jgi:heat shock protein HspQ
MARPFDIGDIVKHKLLGWQGAVMTIFADDDNPMLGRSDVFIEREQRRENGVLSCFLERISGPPE